MARAVTTDDLDEIKRAIETCREDNKTVVQLLSDARVQNEMIFGMVKAAQEHRTLLHTEILNLKASVIAQNGRIRTLEGWKNKAEGAIMGSRWTMALIGVAAGMAGGTGIGIVVK